MGMLVDEFSELQQQIEAIPRASVGGSIVTMAELRLLPLLTTHLSFKEIGERLFVSQNTVKTQAISIYRKLDATSRSDAIQRAVKVGLIESPEPAGLSAVLHDASPWVAGKVEAERGTEAMWRHTETVRLNAVPDRHYRGRSAR